MSGFSLVDLSGFSKPANTLVNKIANAFGRHFDPSQRIRMAEAEAQADRILRVSATETDVEVAELRQRAATRFANEEMTKQLNMENIIEKALPGLDDDANPEEMENGWIMNFFDKGRMVSDDDMQQIWAGILAGEANAPGSYSRKTVNVLADLETDDARLFRNLSMFRMIPADVTFSKSQDRVTEIRPQMHKRPALLVIDSEHPIYADVGINFMSLSRLEWLGLITSAVTGYEMNHTGSGLMIRSFGNELLYVVPSDKSIGLGEYQFTPAGAELSQLCTPLGSPNGFADYIVSVWKSQSIPATRSLPEALAMIQQAQSFEA